MNIVNNWRQLLITLIAALTAMVGDQFGLDTVAKHLIAIIGGSYLGGASIANINVEKQNESFDQQAKSKKFRVTILGVALMFIASNFGIDVGAAIAVVTGSYNIFQGYADRFELPVVEQTEVEEKPKQW